MSEPAKRIGPVEAAEKVLAALAAGDAIADAILLESSAPGAGDPGARLLLAESGEVTGTLGDAALDAAALDALRAQLASGGADGAQARALEVGGETVRVFLEAHYPPDELLVVGAGHIAVPLARIGAMLGFRVTVLDDREEFATEERFPEAARVLRADFSDPFRDVRIGRRSYVVLVTRAHKYDFDCLSRVLAGPDPAQPPYVGMIGSRRRVRGAFEALLAAGVPRARLARVHAPVGLDIGAETPEEIAVSIAAELVRVRHGETGSCAPRSEQENVLSRLLPEESR